MAAVVRILFLWCLFVLGTLHQSILVFADAETGTKFTNGYMTYGGDGNQKFIQDGEYVIYINGYEVPGIRKRSIASDAEHPDTVGLYWGWGLISVSKNGFFFNDEGSGLIKFGNLTGGSCGFLGSEENGGGGFTASSEDIVLYNAWTQEGLYDEGPDNYYGYVNLRGRLYKKGIGCGYMGSQFTSAAAGQAVFSPDGQTVLYSNLDDFGKVYKKDINESGNGILFIDVPNVSYYVIAPNGQDVLYKRQDNTTWKTKLNINDPGEVFINTPILGGIAISTGSIAIFQNATDRKIYQKSITTTSGNGTIFVNAPGSNPIVSAEGIVVYGLESEGVLYKKLLSAVAEESIVHISYSGDKIFDVSFNKKAMSGPLSHSGISNISKSSDPTLFISTRTGGVTNHVEMVDAGMVSEWLDMLSDKTMANVVRVGKVIFKAYQD